MSLIAWRHQSRDTQYLNYRQPLKTHGIWHSAQMMSDFRQKSAAILCVFQGFLTTKTALVGHYDECRDVFRGCLYLKVGAAPRGCPKQGTFNLGKKKIRDSLGRPHGVVPTHHNSGTLISDIRKPWFAGLHNRRRYTVLFSVSFYESPSQFQPIAISTISCAVATIYVAPCSLNSCSFP